MSVRITRMCIPTSYARYSAAVRAIRGVISRSTAGSSARFKKRTAQRPRPLEVVHEHAGLLMRDPHRGEDDAERLAAPDDFGLSSDLQRHLVVRESRAGEQRELLAADQGVQTIDRRDARLDELCGVLPRIRVDRGARD